VFIRVFAYVPFLLWAVYVEEEGWGLSRWLGLVGWIEILLSIVVLDLFDYLWHRANHHVRFLWRFHKAHHADTAMDVTTALRFHPGELLLSALMKAVWIAVWGPTVIAWFLFEALVSLCAQFHHSNIDFPNPVERWLSRGARLLVSTPRTTQSISATACQLLHPQHLGPAVSQRCASPDDGYDPRRRRAASAQAGPGVLAGRLARRALPPPQSGSRPLARCEVMYRRDAVAWWRRSEVRSR
jgi:hypothetical protein